MNEVESNNLAIVRAYLVAVEAGATGDALARFYAPDAVQIELPNRLNPNGGRSDVATLLKRADQVATLLRSQRFEVRSEIAQEGRVAVEAVWSGVLAVPFDTLAAGSSMKAYFAMFFELVDGRIASQRNYDCFEAW
jgi:ketosteroid isomerase-like protein